MSPSDLLTWGICIIADLGCNSKETRFNKELEKILQYLDEADRDNYITLIVSSQFGFLKKIMPNENRTDIPDPVIRTVVFRNKNEAELLGFKDISSSNEIRDLITTYHLSHAHTKFNSLCMWGHGMAYSMFKKSEDHSVPSFADKINEMKYFEMINESDLNNILFNQLSPVSLIVNDIKTHNDEIALTEMVTSDMNAAESKNYLSMSELASAIINAYGKKVDLLILSSCGMAYSRAGISLSEVSDYWLAAEKLIGSYDILPDNFINSLKQQNAESVVRSFAESLYTSTQERHFKLFDMSQFEEYSSLLKKLSVSLLNSLDNGKAEILVVRRKCSSIGNPTQIFKLVSIFDFCYQLQQNESNSLLDARKAGSDFLAFKNDLIITLNQDNFGLSIFFPETPDLLLGLGIRVEDILDQTFNNMSKFDPYSWEYFILNLLRK